MENIAHVRNRLQELLEEKEHNRRAVHAMRQDLEEAEIELEGFRARESQ